MWFAGLDLFRKVFSRVHWQSVITGLQWGPNKKQHEWIIQGGEEHHTAYVKLLGGTENRERGEQVVVFPHTRS